MEPISVTIIIPAYNEEETISAVLSELPAQIDSENLAEVEIIVVDDGSSDNTAHRARQFPFVTLLEHNVNRGYGASLKTGLLHAEHEIVCITDADGTYPNARIPDLVRQLQAGKHDMIVGARTGDRVAIPLIRRPAKWLLSQFASRIAGESIPDLNSGLRIFRRSVVNRFLTVLPDGFSFTTTITLAMLMNGYLVDYVPINYFERGGRSKIRPVRDTILFFQLVMRIALYFAPLRVFLPLSLLTILLAIAWGGYSFLRLGRVADVSTLVVFVTGVQIGVTGLLAELINKRLPLQSKD
jgi:glycosyltransferase involved in cell wall biosynthesis